MTPKSSVSRHGQEPGYVQQLSADGRATSAGQRVLSIIHFVSVEAELRQGSLS